MDAGFQYCTACGAKLAAGDAFCAVCGQPRSDSRGAAPSFAFAAYGRRVFAWIIDTTIVWVPISVAVYLFLLSLPGGSDVNPNSGATNASDAAGYLLIPWALVAPLYSAVLHAIWHGQTVGKRVLGIAVRRDNGSEVGFGQSMGRSYFRLALYSFFGIPWLIDALFPLWEQKNRSLDDRVANTIVIQSHLRGGN
jgi:uncharacterized RDD family membrane protein YckC